MHRDRRRGMRNQRQARGVNNRADRKRFSGAVLVGEGSRERRHGAPDQVLNRQGQAEDRGLVAEERHADVVHVEAHAGARTEADRADHAAAGDQQPQRNGNGGEFRQDISTRYATLPRMSAACALHSCEPAADNSPRCPGGRMVMSLSAHGRPEAVRMKGWRSAAPGPACRRSATSIEWPGSAAQSVLFFPNFIHMVGNFGDKS